ncbi:MAG: fumarylacetoacetate hydrolase family protein [Candidatus Marinimicrobia bacterium]|nr:fumarylacetoacetate hydrolase family protein [Candidatus Neomarinimicrobiota bacterium]
MKSAVLDPVNQDFIVPKIICVGRNYDKHIKEMKSTATAHPMIFLKTSNSIVHAPGPIHLPYYSEDVHHEVELLLLIGEEARNVSEEEAARIIAGVGVGIDLTARDIQADSKKDGKPWTEAKAFDDSAPISNFLSTHHFKRLNTLNIWLEKNGDRVQEGNTKDMIYSIPEIISYISSVMTLEVGDIIFTGTPEGVGPIKSGDHLRVGLEDQVEAEFFVE